MSSLAGRFLGDGTRRRSRLASHEQLIARIAISGGTRGRLRIARIGAPSNQRVRSFREPTVAKPHIKRSLLRELCPHGGFRFERTVTECKHTECHARALKSSRP
eukprot:7681550-Pyramimonas_sp.AAC.1